MEMTLHHLRLLREVAERGTIAAAAAAIGYTPSAVSQQLASLETATGISMLERVGRNVRLTDAGRELVRHATDILTRMEAAQTAIEVVNNEVGGTLDVSVYGSVASALLPPVLKYLAIEHPGLQVRSHFIDPPDSIDMVLRGDLDIAFDIDYSNGTTVTRPGIERVSLIDDHFHLVVNTRLAARLGTTTTLAAVAQEPFIAAAHDITSGGFIRKACSSQGFQPDVVHQLDDYRATLHLIAADQGVSLVPDLALIEPPLGIAVLDLEPPLHRIIQLAYRRASATRPAIVAFKKACRYAGDDLQLVRSPPEGLIGRANRRRRDDQP